MGCLQWGRRNTFITTAVLVIIGTVAQACIQVREHKLDKRCTKISYIAIGQPYPVAPSNPLLLAVSLLHQPVDGYFNIWRQMMFCRFIMGVGIGGEYPLSSSITSETSDEGHRGRNVSVYFSDCFKWLWLWLWLWLCHGCCSSFGRFSFSVWRCSCHGWERERESYLHPSLD